jgi:hypothetical protein
VIVSPSVFWILPTSATIVPIPAHERKKNNNVPLDFLEKKTHLTLSLPHPHPHPRGNGTIAYFTSLYMISDRYSIELNSIQ